MRNYIQSLKKLDCLVTKYAKTPIDIQVDGGYESLDLNSVKEKIAFAQFKMENEWKKHPHQYRIPKEVLSKVNEILKKWNPPKKFTDFDELYNALNKLIGDIDGVGPLMLYDTALRFAEYYGLKPDLVYLHAGAHEGAVCLVNAGLMKMPLNSKMSVSDFPKDLQKLKAKDIEIILCARKKELAALSGK